MSNIRYLIVDDHDYAAGIINEHAGKIPNLICAGIETNPTMAIQKIDSGIIIADLIFVDIQMPGLNGIEFVKRLPEDIKVIFTTSYPKFALEAFGVGAIGYLVKPVGYPEFEKCINLARRFFKEPADYLFIPGQGKGALQRIKKQTIMYVQGAKNYVTIHTKERLFSIRTSIEKIAEELGTEDFRQAQKSFVIRIDKIDRITGNTVYLEDKTTIPLGAKYRQNFLSIRSFKK